MEPLDTLLSPYGCQRVTTEQLSLPWHGQTADQQLLVLPSDNILEVMDATLEDGMSLVTYVAQKLEQARQMTKLDAFGSIVRSFLSALDGVPREKETYATFEAVYAAYISVRDGHEMLEEQWSEPSYSHPDIDLSWIADREEEGLLLLTLPAGESQYAPLIVPMGGFNECPQPLEQVVLFRHWQDEHGMVPLVVTQDTWVVRVSKRPSTEAEALQLAKEHFLFCQYVLDSFDSVGQYAAYLRRHDIWVFWWD
ncbi:DUF4253 domain-containing protein [Paenibacillus hodogayensis]|uniref:DUF4253 domain-containing protein n=1 Tax=Paenibacillus hodogayensis TaxID=279208 RepID=A0ABV5VWU0_9BACL